MFQVVEARLDPVRAGNVISYLQNEMPAFESVERTVWHKLNNGHKKEDIKTWLKKDKGFKERSADAVCDVMIDRRHALLELKKTELKTAKEKLEKVEKDIEKADKFVKNNKEKAATNQLTREELKEYRYQKQCIHQWVQKKQRLVTKIDNLETMIRTKKLSMCFGTKKKFKAQWFLKENGYKNHKEWRQDFRRSRDKNIDYIGRAQETNGCSMCYVSPTDNEEIYTLHVAPYLYRFDKDKKKIKQPVLSCDIRINKRNPYKPLLDEVLHRHALYTQKQKKKGVTQPLACRFVRRGKKGYYLQIIVETEPAPNCTFKFYGTVGVDYNYGFLEMTETNEDGNLILVKRFNIDQFGKGRVGEDNLNIAIKEIVAHAKSVGKDLCIEDLDFFKTKAQCKKASSEGGKNYNRMVHSLNYAHYKEKTKRECEKAGVDLALINPRYSSKNAKPYARRKKLCIHTAASWVIARRGGKKLLC